MNSSVSELLSRALAQAPTQPQPKVIWPDLRQELELHPGPSMRDGQPSWMLHDPVRNQYFQLDWLSFEVLAHWHMGDMAAIAEAIAEETTLRPGERGVKAVANFLVQNQLVHAPGSNSSKELARRLKSGRHRWWQMLLHHYLFFRIPLLKPDALLGRMEKKLAWLFDARFVGLTLFALVAGMLLVYRQWDQFHTTLVSQLSWSGAVSFALALGMVKLVHEFGHGLTAKHFGCRVPTMGLAFLVLFPVPYTDTNEAWKLKWRRQKLLIGSAGVLSELMVAAWATLAWAFLPDGALRHIAFLLCTTTWISTLAVNCSPFMRFDGYFVLSDWLEMPNLHQRAFALGRWKLRQWLFGLDAPPPEYLAPGLTRTLIAFAWLTWIYRLVVFLGIAALVYHFFIKAVGLLLFAVEIIWFVAMPVWNEMRAWREMKEQIRSQSRWRWSAVLLGILLLLAFVPMPGRLHSAGLLHPGEEYPVHAREATQLQALYVKDGAAVRAGAPLASLSTENLDQKLSAARGRIERYDAEISMSAFNAEQRARLQVREGELNTAEVNWRGLELQKRDYQPVAQVDGHFRLADPDLKPGAWLARNEQVGMLVADQGWYVETWVGEEVVHRIAVGDGARFYPEARPGGSLPLVVAAIDRDATHVLDTPVLAAQFGGTVDVREAEGKLVPEKAVYRVRLEVKDTAALFAGQAWRGKVVISAAPESLASRFARNALSLLWREAGL